MTIMILIPFPITKILNKNHNRGTIQDENVTRPYTPINYIPLKNSFELLIKVFDLLFFYFFFSFVQILSSLFFDYRLMKEQK